MNSRLQPNSNPQLHPEGSQSLPQQGVKPAVFFDRDGVVCEYVDNLSRLADFRLRAGIGPAIHKLNQAGFLVFVATNQPNIAKGVMTWKALEEIHQVMKDQITNLGGRIDQVYFCPHHTSGIVESFALDCDCRKPKPGLLEQAAKDFQIDRSRSVMIGDTWRDIECARRFGIAGLGVTGGGGFPYSSKKEEHKYQPKQLFAGPLEAVDWWLSQIYTNSSYKVDQGKRE